MNVAVLEGFAGAGGLSEGCRMLDIGPTLGIEINPNACATAQAAGHARTCTDIRTLTPDTLTGVTGWVSGPPCPTYSAAGKRTGHRDYATVLAGVERVADAVHARPVLEAVTDRVSDPRTALVLQTLQIALALPNLQWIVAEQVPAVRGIWEEIAAELTGTHRWAAADVVTLRADDFGAATRRTRVFLIARRACAPKLDGLPTREHWVCGRFGPGPSLRPPHRWTPFPVTSMADALGWPTGRRVNTRGNRKTVGGNEFSADHPAPTLTYTARSWYRTDLGPTEGRLEPWQAGILQTFPREYPWQGSRTSQFQQIADAVPPVMAAAVIGAATGVDWHSAVTDHLACIYRYDQF